MERANFEPFKMVVRSQEAGSMVQFLDCYRTGHRLDDFLRTGSKYRGRNTSVQSVPSFAKLILIRLTGLSVSIYHFTAWVMLLGPITRRNERAKIETRLK
jgi:hypothetical protein